MGVSLSAPVGEKKRITKPDPKKKTEKFAAVANRPADVELVQLMMVANGLSVPIDGKVSAGLINAIKSFQKSKLGFKKPDGIIDPGGKTWKAGLPKLQARIKADQAAAAQVYEVQEGGKTIYVSKKEFEAKQARMLRKIEIKAEGMVSMAEFWDKTCREADATLQGADTFMMSLVEFSVRTVNSKASPPYGPVIAARGEAMMLKALTTHSKPDWNKIVAQENKAAKAYNKGQRAFNTFIDARIGTAGSMLKGAEITSEISFGVVEAYATGYLVVTRGMPPAKAHAIAAAGTTALKSSSGELGKYLAGNKVDFEKSVKKVFLDTTFAAAAGFVGGKVGKAFLNGAATKLAAKFSSRFSGRLSTKAIDLFFNKFLQTGPGQGMVENAAKEAIGLFKSAVEKGKAPSQKEFEDAVIKILSGSVMNSKAAKSLSAWDVRVPAKTRAYVADVLTPNTLDAIKKDMAKTYGKELVHNTSSAIYKELQENVLRSFGNKAIEQGALYTTERLTGSQTEAQLQKLTEEGVKRDAALRREMYNLMQARLVSELKKQKAAAE